MRKSSAMQSSDLNRSTWTRSSATEKDLRHVNLNARECAYAYTYLELILAVLASSAAIFAYPYAAMMWEQNLPSVLGPALLYGAALASFGVTKRRYMKCVTKPIWYAVSTAFADNLRASAVLIVALFALKASSDLSRVSVLCQVVVVTALTTIARCAWARWAHRRLAAGMMTVSRAVVLGEHARLAQVKASFDLFGKLHKEGVRVVSTTGWPARPSDLALRNLIDSVIGLSREGAIDSVILLPGASNDVVEMMVEALCETPLTIFVAPLVSANAHDVLESRIGGLPVIKITNSPLQHLSSMLKRAFDVAVASLLLFLLFPLFACLALAITTESQGPVFFRQTRHGYGNRYIKVFKFRSMRVLEDGSAFRQATKNDPRITAVGRFIRRTNLDELPQLINVVAGDMSLVGPRPHPVALNDDFAGRIRHFHRRHNIRPGITGWAQVNGYRGETDTYEKMKGRIDHDLWYVDNWSFTLDLRILASTVFSPTAYRNAG